MKMKGINQSLSDTVNAVNHITKLTRGDTEYNPNNSTTTTQNSTNTHITQQHHSTITQYPTINNNNISELLSPAVFVSGTPTHTVPPSSYNPSEHRTYNQEFSIQSELQKTCGTNSLQNQFYNTTDSSKCPRTTRTKYDQINDTTKPDWTENNKTQTTKSDRRQNLQENAATNLTCKYQHLTHHRNPTPKSHNKEPYQIPNSCHYQPKSCHLESQNRNTRIWTPRIQSSPFLSVTLLLLSTLVSQVVCFSANSFTPPRLASYGSWAHEAWLEETGAFVVQWTPRERDIEFRVTARTTGYIGFGLSSKPRMDGADIVVGWVHSGKAYLQDRHGRGNREPSVDQQRDWVLVAGYENHTHTVLIMTRPYNTCDHNDHVVSNDTVRLLWAYHPDDPIDPESPRPRLHYHGHIRRGVKTMFLLERGGQRGSPRSFPPSPYPPSILPPSSPTHRTHHHYHHHHHHHHHHPSKAWVLTNPGVVVEGETDMYWCKVFKRPQLIEKNHVIRYEPVFTPGHEKYVHHIIIYECTDLQDALVSGFEGLAGSGGLGCTSPTMIDYIRSCNHVVVAWAVGSEGLSLPDQAGYPLTPRGPEYYLMETHYDNPEEHHFTDQSGIRITYTPVLRNYDAGVLSVGLDPNWKHLIPPRQKTVLSEGHCVGECTAAAFPPSGINVFAVILHTHLLGRRVRVRHIRKGRELQPIAMDNNYDFNYQEYRALHTPRTVMPGDHLIGECTYNSWERSTITLGGFKTRDEMCLSFLFYWPRVDLSLCHSKPSLNTVLHSLGIEELAANSNPIKIRRPIDLAGKTLEWRLTNYNWTQHFDYFQHTTHSGTFNPMCWRRGRSIIKNVEEVDYEYPNVTNPWKPESVCRQRTNKNKRMNKNRDTNRPRDDGEQEGEANEGGEEEENKEEEEEEKEDVMSDYQTNSRPIQRIDVDPSGHIDVFMPVVEEGFDGVQPGDNLGPQDNEDDLKEEFEDMEKDLEKEMAGRGRTASKNRSGDSDLKAGTSVNQIHSTTLIWTMVLCVCLVWLREG